ncbi:TetR/AcrR family transcriptional regulator [Marinitenerispora sediminis]|uniref:TetR/AcrR family transcriptional regulator n=1 Tax=Marinitenerispora sediminis TaxID=1931232 RepID=A0A368SZU3_9ACTN|nr:TetR/AcrR family transcriptional regulator [Marinitenerispora sediminis]RCV51653.1 TetR/AcrR family transcriptional regulator [Marinitenerispora sediminis]RCV54434.1 TetR/AcrR family transcriptional regulator [Marinitenerispora sediminis]RCV55344.1 TetR/AcrR family transcriptional regulator [Marinitenerispora sediminis]
MRADARRNRELIVTTAADLFVERGPEVSMEEIARAAGVGVGTLYRHFPDRRALVEAISVDALQRLLDYGRAVSEQDVSGWEALRLIVRRCTELPLALATSVTGGSALPGRAELPGLVQAVNAELEWAAARAQREGTLRRDIPAREVIALISVAVCRPGARIDDPLVRVVFDGLRATGA